MLLREIIKLVRYCSGSFSHGSPVSIVVNFPGDNGSRFEIVGGWR
jgi:hypothetical protein